MKKLTLLLFTILSTSFLGAQTFPVSVSGMVSNLDGSPAEGVNIFISTDSMNFNFEYFDQTTTAADGTYNFTFDVPDANSQGGALVYMESCENDFEFEVVNWFPTNTDLTVDFTYCLPGCDVSITSETNPTGAGTATTLTAASAGTAPFSYQWDTGETTASITVLESGWYCATITDGTGCTSSNCFYADNTIEQDSACWAFIFAFFPDSLGTNPYLGVEADGTAPFTYTWNTGQTDEAIVANESGVYCVTVTDAIGCLAVDCYDYQIEDCSASIFCSIDGELIANAIGVGPFSYEWNTGETTASIFPSATGDYCVTVTDATGCTTEVCTFHFEDGGQDTSCWVTITEVQNGAWLNAEGTGAGSFIYFWSDGTTGSSIELTSSGEYCVTAIDADSCVSVACYTYVSNEPDNYRIQGYAFPLDSNNVFFNEIVGLAYLIVHDEDAGTLTAIDTVELQDFGYYDFGDVPAGDYLVKAAYSEDSELYETNLPTYYGHVLWWHEATTITVPYSGWGGFTVTMVEGENSGGPGFIGGLISEGANFDGEIVDERSGDPLAGISVLLLTEDDEPVTHTVSNENGEFAFPDLAWGTYKVYVEVIGLEQVFYLVTIGPDQPEVNNLTFVVGEEGVLNVSAFLTADALQVFPNPAQHQVMVNINSPKAFDAQINITDLRGQTLWTQPATIRMGTQQFDLNISELPKGIYFLNVQTGKDVISKKIVKL